MARQTRFSGKYLGSFGDLGGEVIFEWEPTQPDEVAAELLEVAGYLENIETPLVLSRHVLQDDIRMRFETKIDPDGNEWAPWSENYANYRERNYPEGGILVRTTELQNAATTEGAYEVGPAGVFYNTAGLPEYWLWTQEGAERSAPTGATAGMTSAEKQHMAASLGVSVKSLEAVQSGGNTLPARPFVGSSDEAEIQIMEIFDKWFDGAIRLATSPKGKVFAAHAKRGASGRFVSRD